MSNKDIVLGFIGLVDKGEVEQAFEKYVSLNFIHHNASLAAGRESMMQTMKLVRAEVFDIKNIVCDDKENKVVIHAFVKINSDFNDMLLVQIYKLENSKIVEMWDIGQELPKEILNADGAF